MKFPFFRWTRSNFCSDTTNSCAAADPERIDSHSSQDDAVDVILQMAHDTKAVHVSLLKDHDNPRVSELKIALDPTTMLLRRER